MKMPIKILVLQSLRILLGGLFVVSGVLKFTDLVAFHDAIEAFDVLPISGLDLATVLIPSIEVVCGGSLIINLFVKHSCILLLIMLITFTIAIIINMARGVAINCGCFGSLDIFTQISMSKIVFNVTLMISIVSLKYISHSDFEHYIYKGLLVMCVWILTLTAIVNELYLNMNMSYTLKSRYIERAKFEEAMLMLHNSNALLFDARSKIEYDINHVPGALPIPIAEFTKYYSRYSKMLKNNVSIYIYCGGDDCTASQRLGFRLLTKEVGDIHIISEGWARWRESALN